MIMRIARENDELFSRLKPCHYGRRIRSHYMAYSIKYDFSKMYLLESGGEQKAVISLFNRSMVIGELIDKRLSGDDIEELALFIQINLPASVELDPVYASVLSPLISELYSGELRTEFAYNSSGDSRGAQIDEFPSLDSVFDILRGCFPALNDSGGLWIADTSHRIRRGMSQSFLMNGCTTATLQYALDGVALIGNVATKKEYRGQFYARRLLYRLGERLTEEGWSVRLFARPHRVSYYEEIGFAAISHDIVFELQDEKISEKEEKDVF